MIETMPAELAENLIDFCENRSRVYALLSRCYETEIDAAFAEALAGEAALASDDAGLAAGFAALQADLAGCDEDALEQLAVVFDRAFFGMGPRTAQKAFPYESVYTSPKRLMMQDARDEVLVLYRAFGLDKQESWKEGEDHIALELEFEQILCERAIAAYEAGDEDECLKLLLSQRNFLEDHLLAWYPMMAADLQKFPQTDFYKGLGKLTDGFLRNDREFLDAALSENEAEVEVA